MPPLPAITHAEIWAGCHLTEQWCDWFAGLEFENLPDGRCRLRLPCPDQASLYGVLIRLRDLGIPLLAVSFQNEL